MGLHHSHPPNRPHPPGDEPAGLGRDECAATNLRVARLSVITATVLALAKLAAVVMTGSLAVAAALTDSVMDVIASSVNFFAVRVAGQPADDEHRYGHGKAEGIAGLGQGLLILFVGLYLGVGGANRLIQGGYELAHGEVGIGVMLLSLVASAWIGWLLLRTGRRTGSVALQADAAHYTSDVWMNLGVLASLLIVKATGWHWVDGAVSCAVALIVLWTAFRVLRSSARELMDASLSTEQIDRIRATIAEQVPEAFDVHNLRTRKSGPDIFIEMHVAFDRELSFPEAHLLSDRVAKAVEAALPGAQVHVHADPHPFLPEDSV